MVSIRGLTGVVLVGHVSVAVLVGCAGDLDRGAAPPRAPEPPRADSTASGSLGLRTLVGWQYRNAVADLLGPAAASAVSPPEDVALHGFEAVGTAQLPITVDRASAYQSSAYAAASAALADPVGRDALVGCRPTSIADDACVRSFVRVWGARAWRRPLDAEEVSAWVSLAMEASRATADVDEGFRFVIAGFLQAPSFLYQVGVGVRDGERARIGGWEMATRLAFFLTGTTPDEELLVAAESGELDEEAGVRRHAQRLLTRVEAEETVERFFDEVLGWRGLTDMRRDSALYPGFDEELASAMREESRRFLEEIIWTADTDFRDFFRADYTYVDSRLAALYGLSAPPGSGFIRTSLTGVPQRGGILGQASFLAVSSRESRTSPTTRGRLIRQRLLCESIPPPPPGVSTVLPEDDPGTGPRTTRDRLARHRTDPSCSGCHARMDDMGLGLESFDAIGAFRTTESGLPIDATSTFDDLGDFTGPRELGELLAADPRTTACLVQSLFRVATGRRESAGDATALRAVGDVYAAEGHSFQALLVALVTSDAFRFAALPEGVMP